MDRFASRRLRLSCCMTSTKPPIPAGGPGTAKANLNLSKEGWYTETSTLWPGQGLSLQVDEILFQDRSDFQVSGLSLVQAGTLCKWQNLRKIGPVAVSQEPFHEIDMQAELTCSQLCRMSAYCATRLLAQFSSLMVRQS